MSRRTAEADKAIRLAWENERALVKEGKGTRDWTEEQQKDIIKKGKAYDGNGRAFEGQHMKSAEEYPQFQGDPGNIQFLTREEHLEAHQGNWQNPTNGYFDPVTKEMIDFGEGKYIPCKVIELSKPITIAINKANPETNNTRLNKTQQQETVHNNVPDKPQAHSSPKNKGTKTVKSPAIKKQSPKRKEGAFEKIGKNIYSINKARKEHPIITGIATLFGTIIVAVAQEKITNGVFTRENLDNYSQSNDNDLSFDYEEKSAIDDNLENTSVNDSLGTSTRSSPCKHEVTGHSQLYHTKNGDERREKAPYSRGGKKEDDIDSKQ